MNSYRHKIYREIITIALLALLLLLEFQLNILS